MAQQSLHPHYALWLEEHALADESMAHAYEQVDGRDRAALKKCIARLYRLWGESPLEESRFRRLERDFYLEVRDEPVSYALFLCEAGYAHPAGLIAALLPAVLAGARTIVPCFVKEKNALSQPFAPLLAALELCGVEKAFCASPDEAEALFLMLEHEGGHGRLVVLGSSCFGRGSICLAHEKGVICRSLTGPLLYHSQRLGKPAQQRFGQHHGQQPDAALAEAGVPEDTGAGLLLHLDEAHEDVWVWPDMSPAWFRTRKMGLFADAGPG